MSSVPPLSLSIMLAVAASSSCTAFNGLSLPLDAGLDTSSGPPDTGIDASGPDSYAKAVLRSGPIAYYRLDETSGLVAHDISGHGNDCNYTSGVTLGVPGIVADNSAVRFERLSPELGIACNTKLFAFQGTSQFSVEGWYSPDVLDGRYQAGFSRLTGNPRSGYYMYLQAPTPTEPLIGFEFWDDRNLACSADGASIPCPGLDGSACGGFVYVVTTFDGHTMTVFVNGKVGTSALCAAGLTGVNEAFTMANYSSYMCPTCGLVGALDEVAIYDRALDPDEIQAHYIAR
jgi:hypothetical protein